MPVLIQVRMAAQEGRGTPFRHLQYAGIANAQRPVLTVLRERGVPRAAAFEAIPFIAAHLDAGGLRRIQSLTSVLAIYEDGIRVPALSDSRVLVGAATAHTNGVTGIREHAGGPGSYHIAVIDTGVDQAHESLPRVSSGACYSQSTSRYWNTCPGGVNSEAAFAGRPCTFAGCDHGTHVAGIAAGQLGMAPGASILPVNVASYDSWTNRVVFFDSDVIRAMEFVWRQHEFLMASVDEAVAAVNLSLGGGRFTDYCDTELPALKAAIDHLRSVGIASVVASGNEGYVDAMTAPACISSAISVGSTTKDDAVSDFTNTASFLSLLAPGSSINAAVPGGSAYKSGTSMAAPHVAGAWALLKQVASRASVTDIAGALRQMGQPILDPGNGLTFPRIQVNRALARLAPRGELSPVLFNFDNDQYMDVLLYDDRTGHWSIKRGTSTGMLAMGPSGQWATSLTVHVADFNGNGRDDIFLYAPSTGQFWKAINQSGSGFSYFSQGWQAGFDVHIVDLDGDGQSDVFVYNPVTGVWFTCISTGDGTGGFSYASGHWAAGWQVRPADFNADGKTDLFLYSPISGLYYKAIGLGDGRLAYTAVGVWALTWTPHVADLNGDGHDDVFLYDAVSGVWYRCLSTGDGTGEFAYTLGQWAPGYTLQVADFNGNGTSDLFLYQRASGLWYKALSSDRGFTYPDVGVWASWNTTVSDMQRNGRSDLFLYDPASRVWYWAITDSVSDSFSYVSGAFTHFEHY